MSIPAAVDLPAETHAAVLRGRDVVTGQQAARPVVWADRPYDRCPGCGEPVSRVVDCPVVLNAGAGQGDRLEEWSQQHGCGQWLAAVWREVAASGAASEATTDDVVAAATELAAAIDTERRRLRARLREDLTRALARLAEPLADGETLEDRADEVRIGSQVDPGVYWEDGPWVAWDYDPAGSGGPITVHAEDLRRSLEAITREGRAGMTPDPPAEPATGGCAG